MHRCVARKAEIDVAGWERGWSGGGCGTMGQGTMGRRSPPGRDDGGVAEGIGHPKRKEPFAEESLEHVDDLPGRVAGPVRVLPARPALAGAHLHLGPDGLLIEAHDPGVAGLDGLGPLGRGAQHKSRLADGEGGNRLRRPPEPERAREQRPRATDHRCYQPNALYLLIRRDDG
jgi:hypothetical protein